MQRKGLDCRHGITTLNALLLLIIILLPACENSPPASVTPIVIRVGHGHTANHSYQIGLEQSREIIERETAGRITLEFYPEAQLGNERQMQNMLSAGTLDMTVTGLMNIYDPAFALFDFPYLYEDREHIKRVMASDLMQEMQQPLVEQGLRILGIMEVGFRNITSNHPITTPEDLAGFRIRTPESPAQIETFKALGAVPVPMSFNMLYGALEDGVVDGQENPLENIYNAEFYKVQKYVTMSRHIYNFAYVLVSETFWQSLSAEDQELLAESIQLGCNYQIDYLAQQEQILEQRLKAEGMEFIYPDQERFKKAVAEAYDSDFVKNLAPRASRIFESIKALEHNGE